ncbi:MAG: alpha/beta hydrolase [Ahrensia sp.]|nr:alpha/beta hydrolase [Ahrensia sp.]
MEVDITQTHLWQGQTVDLAVKRASRSDNSQPGFVWLGGFRSDMLGGKAQTMVEEAQRMGAASLRFDYSGHGLSGGAFRDGTISRWVDESCAVFRRQTEGPQVLIGSSMGAWIALRLCLELMHSDEAHRICGMILIAPAADFTAVLMEPTFTPQQRQDLESKGYVEEESAYSDEPNIITKSLIDDGRSNLVLGEPLKLGCPVHILQGMQDPDVPYTHALQLVGSLAQDDVVMTLIKDGDHRLSRDNDLELLARTMRDILRTATQ